MKLKRFSILSVLLAVSACSLEDGANTELSAGTDLPTPYHNCPSIRNSTSAMVLGSKSCDVYYVLPPQRGVVETKQVALSASAQQCDDFTETMKEQSAMRRTVGRLNRQYEDIEVKLKDAIALTQKTKLVEAEACSQIPDSVSTLTRMAYINSRLKEIDGAWQTAYGDLSKCQELECVETLQQQIEKLESEKQALSKELNAMSSNVAVHRCREAQANTKVFEQAEEDVFRSMETVRGKLNEQVGEMQKTLESFAKVGGGTARISYRGGWNEAIAKLQSENPGKKFQPIRIRNARVYVGVDTGAMSEDSYRQSIPALLGYQVNGKSHLPFGNTGTDLSLASTTELVSDVALSVAGACSIKQNGNTFHGSQFAITYDYQTFNNLHVEASFNLFKVYEEMRKSSSKNGFFSTKTYNSLKRSTKLDEHFSFKLIDEGGQIKDEGKVREQVRERLITRVVSQMGIASPNGDPNKPGLTPPPQSGAGQIGSDMLGNPACAANVYCAVGGFILKGLDSIFGSKSAVAEFKETHDMSSKETWDSTTPVWELGGVVFAVE